MLALIYLAVRRMLALILLRCRSQEFKELEIVVLRHELEILRRQTRRPELRPADRHSWPLQAGSCHAYAGARSSSRRTRSCAGIASSWRGAGPTRAGDPAALELASSSASSSCASRARTPAGLSANRGRARLARAQCLGDDGPQGPARGGARTCGEKRRRVVARVHRGKAASILACVFFTVDTVFSRRL